MRKKLIALCLAFSALAALPSTALGYWINGWGPLADNAGTSYTYAVEVCVGASTGSTIWDTAGIPLHARAQNAMAQWNNNTNGEFFLVVSNACGALDTSITINKANYGAGFKAQLANLDYDAGCAQPWDCIRKWELKINLYYSWWNQAGTPNPNQYDLYSAFTHEFGHAQSLGHSLFLCDAKTSGSASMCDSLALGESWMRSVATDDLNAYIARYGTTH